MEILEDRKDKLKVFPKIEVSVSEGNFHNLDNEDKEIFNLKEPKIMEEIELFKKKDFDLVKEKGKAREGLHLAEKNLQRFAPRNSRKFTHLKNMESFTRLELGPWR